MKARAALAVIVLALAACAAPTDDGTGTGGTDTGTGTGGTTDGGTGTDTGTGTGGGTGAGGGAADEPGTGGTGTGTGTTESRVATIGEAGIACDAYAATLRQMTLRHDQGALDAGPLADTMVVVEAAAPRCEDPSPPVAGGEPLVRLQIAANALIGLTEGREMTVLELSATDSPFLLAENDERLEADIEPLPMPAHAPAAVRRTLFDVAVAGAPHWAAYRDAPATIGLPQATQDWAGVNGRARAARLAWEASVG